MEMPNLGHSLYSLEYSWGTVDTVSDRDQVFRMVFKGQGCEVLEWYNKNGERLAPIKTKQTLFRYPQEILPLTLGSPI